MYGIDINRMAVDNAKRFTGFDVVEGNVFKLPFRDNYFDLVFTDGLLIHINPDDLVDAMSEIYRVSNYYVMGIEYYDKVMKMIRYHGLDNVLWKGNYCDIYQKHFGLVLLAKKKLCYKDSDNVDMAFLLKREDTT